MLSTLFHNPHIMLALIGALALGLALSMKAVGSPNVRDASLLLSLALPSAASTTVTSATGIDTGVTTADATQPGNVEFLLSAPALNTTQLPDTKTCTYNVIVSAASNMGTPTTMFAAVITQTGAGGVGAAAATYRFRMPSVLPGTLSRYVGFTAVTGASTGDCSAASATLELLV